MNEKSFAYGATKSSIRELAAYAAARKAEIGAENVFDFGGSGGCAIFDGDFFLAQTG